MKYPTARAPGTSATLGCLAAFGLLSLCSLGAAGPASAEPLERDEPDTEVIGPPEDKTVRPIFSLEMGWGLASLDHGPSKYSVKAGGVPEFAPPGGFPAEVKPGYLWYVAIDGYLGRNVASLFLDIDYGSIERNDLFRLEADFLSFGLTYRRVIDIGPWWLHILPQGSIGYGEAEIQAVSGPEESRRLDAWIKGDGMVYGVGGQVRIWLPPLQKESRNGRVYFAINYVYRFAKLDVGERYRSDLNIPSKFIFDNQDEMDYSGHLIMITVGASLTR